MNHLVDVKNSRLIGGRNRVESLHWTLAALVQYRLFAFFDDLIDTLIQIFGAGGLSPLAVDDGRLFRREDCFRHLCHA